MLLLISALSQYLQIVSYAFSSSFTIAFLFSDDIQFDANTIAITNTKIIDGDGYNWTSEKGSYVGMPTFNGTVLWLVIVEMVMLK